MSDLFKTVLLKDPIIADITDSLDYAVISGASSSTYQQYNANSQSASNIVFQIQLPSTSVVMDRHILIQSTINFTLTVPATANVPAGYTVFDYGLTDAFQAFPLNKLFSTATATINNMTVAVNTQDVIDVLLRLNDSRELYRYNGMTPTLPDQVYGNYSDAYLTNANPLASINNQSYDNDQVPRGAYPATFVVNRYTTAGGVNPVDNSPIALGQAAAPGENWKILGTVTVTEPLVGLSPFIFGNTDMNCGGMVGINTVTLTLNIDSSAKRFFSTRSPYSTISLGIQGTNNGNPFQNTRMLMHFLSTQPSDRIRTRCVSPYSEFPRFISTPAVSCAPNSITPLTSQSIQLNQLPDYFIIYARNPMTGQTIQNSASFLSITGISVNLNNTSGLLASATQQDLWRISRDNHSTQSFLEFLGSAAYNNNATGISNTIPTIGSILILSPSKDLSLPDYLTSGSIGQFQINFILNVKNQFAAAITPEIVMVTVNSGIFISEEGSAQVSTGILTKQMVLDTKEEKSEAPYSTAMYKRMVGGSLNNMALGALKKHRHMFDKVLHHIRQGVKRHVVPAVDALAKSGYARAKRQIEDFL